MATLNRADIYGGPSSAVPMPDPVGVSGPNQGSVTPTVSATNAAGVGAAASWLGFFLLLVALRLLIEYG